uniref:Uncharacterized protein n=1 Tax=Arundo donax TaxID=35708 RepID=A0A0A9A3S0_ARUDO
MSSFLMKPLKLKVFCMMEEMIVQWLSIGMRMRKKCPVQTYLGLLLEKPWERMNNLSYVEVQE